MHHSPDPLPMRPRARGTLTRSFRSVRRTVGHRSVRLALGTMVTGAATAVALLGPPTSESGHQPSPRPYDSSTWVAGSSSSIGDPAVAPDGADDAASSSAGAPAAPSGHGRPAAPVTEEPASTETQASPGTPSPAAAPGTGGDSTAQASPTSTTAGTPIAIGPVGCVLRGHRRAVRPRSLEDLGRLGCPDRRSGAGDHRGDHRGDHGETTSDSTSDSTADSTSVPTADSRSRENCRHLPDRPEDSRGKHRDCDSD